MVEWGHSEKEGQAVQHPGLGLCLKFLWSSNGTKVAGDSKGESARMGRYGVGKVREEIRKGLGTRG